MGRSIFESEDEIASPRPVMAAQGSVTPASQSDQHLFECPLRYHQLAAGRDRGLEKILAPSI